MSELDQLRGLLDEAGVGYLNRSSDITIGYYTDPQTVTEAMDGTLQVTGLTAEQVMRALGHSSTARAVGRTTTADETECIDARCYGDPHGGDVYHIHVMECGACGRTYEHVNGNYEYCPHCRARIVEVDNG